MNKQSRTSKRSTINLITEIKANGRKSSVLLNLSQIYAISQLLIKKALKRILKTNQRKNKIMKNKLSYLVKYAKSLTSMK